MRLLNKTQMNFAYGMGAAVVIIGALMKITHYDLPFITANTMLTIGLVTEALIFALSAFDPPEDGYDWKLVYPELGDSNEPKRKPKSPEQMLNQKIEDMLAQSKVDKELVSSLSASIKNFEASAKSGSNSAAELAKINKEFANNANQLQKQMESLANNLESLNNVYGGVLNAMNKK
tara:strand:+ start:592 stop:1119 length:528 start_codon:yes stop_codon:yes gene_type:complete